MSYIKRYLEDKVCELADREGISEEEAMDRIMSENGHDTKKEEIMIETNEEKNVQMKVAYTKIDYHLREIEKLMKRYDIHEFNNKITADGEVIFTAAFKRV